MDVITQNINGKDYKFRFDMKAVFAWMREEEVSLPNTQQVYAMTPAHYINLMRWANHSANGKKFSASFQNYDKAVELFDKEPASYWNLAKAMFDQLSAIFDIDEDDEKKENP
jgi:hypothetical protein